MRTVLTTLHSKFIHASLALPYLAAWCGDDCGDISILEFTDHEPKENIAALLLAEAPDVVAFSVYIWNRVKTLELVDLLHSISPGVKIVLGGPEVSFDGEELFIAHPGIAAVVHGEGEIPVRMLLRAWSNGDQPAGAPRLSWRDGEQIRIGPQEPPIPDLDLIPSPHQSGLTDLSRGFSYVETSRGCPYRCSFCMSALDDSVRSFGMERIKADLLFLIEQQVPKIKLVDRTFNYDTKRARDIFAFIIEHNRSSHFHFEIGAHLLDEKTIQLLEQVPQGMFQFEIGVQSTLSQTLDKIGRKVPTAGVLDNVAALLSRTRVDIHLDLIAGLPGETYADFLQSINTVMALDPEHLQIEPVKLLPGAPLRRDAARLGIRFDPNPPYTITCSDTMSYRELEQIRAISRLLDLSWNSHRLHGFLRRLSQSVGSFAAGLEKLATFLRDQGAFRHPIGQPALFQSVWAFVQSMDMDQELLQESLARDFALCERILPGQPAEFFDTELSDTETVRVREQVQQEIERFRGSKAKLQYFAARFRHLAPHKPHVRLYLYLTRSGRGQEVIERILAE